MCHIVCHWETDLRTGGGIYLNYLLRRFKIRGFLFTHVKPAVATPPATTVNNSAFLLTQYISLILYDFHSNSQTFSWHHWLAGLGYGSWVLRSSGLLGSK
jgi:hypothetical protein